MARPVKFNASPKVGASARTTGAKAVKFGAARGGARGGKARGGVPNSGGGGGGYNPNTPASDIPY